eukprot:1302734-Pyramimonas_sp.AAC.1
MKRAPNPNSTGKTGFTWIPVFTFGIITLGGLVRYIGRTRPPLHGVVGPPSVSPLPKGQGVLPFPIVYRSWSQNGPGQQQSPAAAAARE